LSKLAKQLKKYPFSEWSWRNTEGEQKVAKVSDIFKYSKDSKSNEYDFLPDKYKDLHANDIETDDKMAGYISCKLLRVDRAKIGDKVTNRYGGKGIISLVLPDECMPQIVYSDGRRIAAEEILNPAGVLHRKNISQIYECALTKCIFEIYRRCGEFVANGDFKSMREFLDHFKAVYDDKFTKMSDEELSENHLKLGIQAYKMSVGFYSKVNYNQILDWMKYLKIKDTDKVYCPDITIVETKQGLKGYLTETYEKKEGEKPKHYELGWCEQECITGSEYIMKLWKQASYDGKVTNEVLDSVEPVMGRGVYRWTGQKIGEMELWILIGQGIEKFMQEQSDTMKTSQYQFLNELLLSGYFIQDAQGSPLLSRERSHVTALNKL
jgi:DNA-directed RNA polymerase beta subunit